MSSLGVCAAEQLLLWLIFMQHLCIFILLNRAKFLLVECFLKGKMMTRQCCSISLFGFDLVVSVRDIHEDY